MGGVVYRGSSSSYYGVYFYGDFIRGWVKYLTFNSDGKSVKSSTSFDDNANQIVSFKEGNVRAD